MQEIRISSSRRSELIEITDRVSDFLSGMEVSDGVCHVYCPHTTAGLIVNESADPSVARDIEKTLGELVPESRGYQHSEGNADAHIKATIVGSSVWLPVKAGSLKLGTWQGIFLCEFDGPRSRRIWITVTGS